MFDYDDAVGVDEFGGGECVEKRGVFLPGVGGIGEDNVVYPVELGKLLGDVDAQGLCSFSEMGVLEILLYQRQRRRGAVDKIGAASTTTERFDAVGTGTGEEIEEARAVDVVAEDAEEGFTHFIQGRSNGVVFRGD